MIGGIVLALLGAASIIVALFAQQFGADEKQTKTIKQVGWILGIILLVSGTAWIGTKVYTSGVAGTTNLLAAQTAYQVARNQSNPDVITAQAQAYNDCYNNCLQTSSWWQRTFKRAQTQARCDSNCS